MGLVVIGMLIFICIYIIVLISLFVLLGKYIIKNTKKVGLQRAIKSKTALIIIFFIFICGGLPPLLFVSMSTPRSGNQLFEDLILDPIPESVEVLDSFDGSTDFRAEHCIHFRISPDDFKLILATKNWKVVSEDPFAPECEFMPPPPALLDSNIIMYTYDENNITEVMVTNTQMSEIYYYFWNGNVP